jgi:uncharacterized protein involved in oxidation of intracellular sulfur
MIYLFILNDSPYQSQRVVNGLRLAGSLAKRSGNSVQIFLFGDGIISGVTRVNAADAGYNVQETLRVLAAQNIAIKACKTCMEARGVRPEDLAEGVERGTLDELTEWTEDADRVLVF